MFLSQNKYRSDLRTILISTLILISIILLTQNVETAGLITVSSCVFIVIIGVLFYSLNVFFLIIAAAVPLSVNLTVFGGAQVNFPGEGLLLCMLFYFVFFSKNEIGKLRKILNHPITILLIADVLFQVLTSLTGTDLGVSLKRVALRVAFILGFYFISNLILKKEHLLKPWIFYAIGLVPVMYFTLQKHLYYSFNPRVVFSICQPFYDDHTIYGACLAFIIPVLLIVLFKRKVFRLTSIQYCCLAVLLIFIVVSELLALSRAAILSLGVSFLFAILLRFKVSFKQVLLGLGVILFIGFMFYDSINKTLQKNETVSNDGQIGNHFSSVTNLKSDASNLERINRWICAYRMFEERPLVGFGPGTYQFEYIKFQTSESKTYISTNTGDRGNAHSEYLTYLSENGIFGFLLFVLTVFTTIFYGMKNHYNLKDEKIKLINLGVLLGVVTFFFHGLFNSFLDQSKMAFLYFFAIGTIVWINQHYIHSSISNEK